MLLYLCEAVNKKLNNQEIEKVLLLEKDIKIVDDKLKHIIYLLSLIEISPEIVEEEEKSTISKDIQFLERTNAYEITLKLIDKSPRFKSEKYYITAQLLSVIQGNLESESDKYFVNLMERIINNVKAYAGVNFPDSDVFRKNLYNHLVPAYYRLKYGVVSINPYIEQVLEEYKDLFYLMKKSLKPLSDDTGIELTDDEVAYFVMHFGGYLLTNQSQDKFKLFEAIVICPYSVETSILISDFLVDAMPEIEFVNFSENSDLEFHHLIEKVDFIVSTHEIASDKPVYLINSNFSRLDLGLLKRNIYTDFRIPTHSMQKTDKILKLIDNIYDIPVDIGLQIEIDYLLDEHLNDNQKALPSYTISEYLSEDKILLLDRIDSWEEAIRQGSQVLIEQNYLTEDYVNSMIQSVLDYGPYIEIAPKVAMPHAKPESRAKKLGLSMVRVKEPVMMGNANRKVPINLFFIISIPDHRSHLKLLKDLHQLVDNSENVNRLIYCSNKLDIIASFSNIL